MMVLKIVFGIIVTLPILILAEYLFENTVADAVVGTTKKKKKPLLQRITVIAGICGKTSLYHLNNTVVDKGRYLLFRLKRKIIHPAHRIKASGKSAQCIQQRSVKIKACQFVSHLLFLYP